MPTQVNAAMASAMAATEALSTTVAAAATASDTTPTEAPVSVAEYAEAAPVEVERPAFAATGAAAPPESGLEPRRYATAATGRARRSTPLTVARAASSRRSSPRTNQPPMFSAPTYAFETPAGRAVRGMAVPLGAVLARDPDSDPVT